MKRTFFLSIIFVLFIAGLASSFSLIANKRLHVVHFHGFRPYQSSGPLEAAVKKIYGAKSVHYKRIMYGKGTAKDARSNIELLAKEANDQIISDPELYDKETGRYKVKIVLFGQSMGVMVAKFWMQRYCNPKDPCVDLFLSSVGTHGGYYGLPDHKIVESSVQSILNRLWPVCLDTLKPLVVKIGVAAAYCLYPCASCCFYTSCFQRGDCCCSCCPFPNGFSIANYWNDPKYQNAYFLKAQLARFNNRFKHDEFDTFKSNMENAHHVTIYSTNDPIAKPNKSGEYLTPQEVNSGKKTISFTDSDQYKNDQLGLRALYDGSKRLIEAVKDVSGTVIGKGDIGTYLSLYGIDHEHSGPYDPTVLDIMLEHINKSYQRINPDYKSRKLKRNFSKNFLDKLKKQNETQIITF